MISTRSCIACRSRESSTALLHLVMRAGEVLPDPLHMMGGRGAWLHPRRHCFDVARQRRSFGRAFKTSEELSTERLELYLDHGTMS